MTFLDGTSIRVHQKAAGAAKKGATAPERDEREALGRSRGGFATKVCVIADSAGRAVAFSLAPGQVHELPYAVPLWVAGDRGYCTPTTPSESTSGISAHGLPSRPRRTRPRSPTRTGSITTATGSNVTGPGSRSGAPSPPVTRKLPHPFPASYTSPPSSTGSGANRP